MFMMGLLGTVICLGQKLDLEPGFPDVLIVARAVARVCAPAHRHDKMFLRATQ
jgi:hypothetical protein